MVWYFGFWLVCFVFKMLFKTYVEASYLKSVVYLERESHGSAYETICSFQILSRVPTAASPSAIHQLKMVVSKVRAFSIFLLLPFYLFTCLENLYFLTKMMQSIKAAMPVLSEDESQIPLGVK